MKNIKKVLLIVLIIFSFLLIYIKINPKSKVSILTRRFFYGAGTTITVQCPDQGTSTESSLVCWQNLVKAFSSSSSGDTIIINEGTYSASSSIIIDGKKNITIKPNNGNVVIKRSSYNKDEMLMKIRNGSTVVIGDKTYTNKIIFDGDNLSNVTAPLVGISSGSKNNITNVELHNITLKNNTNTSTSTSGGGLYIDKADVTMNHIMVLNNQARNGGGIYIKDINTNFGYHTNVTINNSTSSEPLKGYGLQNNTATNNGGAIYVGDSRTLELNNVYINNNSAGNTANGVYFEYSNLRKYVSVTGNNANDTYPLINTSINVDWSKDSTYKLHALSSSDLPLLYKVDKEVNSSLQGGTIIGNSNIVFAVEPEEGNTKIYVLDINGSKKNINSNYNFYHANDMSYYKGNVYVLHSYQSESGKGEASKFKITDNNVSSVAQSYITEMPISNYSYAPTGSGLIITSDNNYNYLHVTGGNHVFRSKTTNDNLTGLTFDKAFMTPTFLANQGAAYRNNSFFLTRYETGKITDSQTKVYSTYNRRSNLIQVFSTNNGTCSWDDSNTSNVYSNCNSLLVSFYIPYSVIEGELEFVSFFEDGKMLLGYSNDIDQTVELYKTNFSVDSYFVTIPTSSSKCNNLVYNGKEQTITKSASTGYTFRYNKQTNAGSYDVQAELDNSHFWNDASTNNKTISCSIAKKTATVTAANKTISYGDNAPTFTSTQSGAVGSDSIVTGNITYTVKSGNDVINLSSSTPAGTYTIVPSGTESSNYDVTFKNGTLTINKISPTITMTNQEVTYNGSAQSYTGATINPSHLSNLITYKYYSSSSNCSSGTSALSSVPVNAGTYYVKASISAGTNNNAATSSCAKFKINKKTATITPTNVSMTYGDSVPNITFNVTGGIGSESPVSGNITPTFKSGNTTINVGKTTAAGKYTIFPSATANSNYSLSLKSSILTIKKATPTVTLAPTDGLIYAGTEQGVKNDAVVTLKNNETYSKDISYKYYTDSSCTTLTNNQNSGATSEGGAPLNAGHYYVMATTVAFGNYNASSSFCTNHVIAQRTPVVTLDESSLEIEIGDSIVFNEHANTAGVFSHSSSNSSVASVSPTYSPEVEANKKFKASVTGLSSGTSSISVYFVPTDSTNFSNVYTYGLGVTVNTIVGGRVTIPTAATNCNYTVEYKGNNTPQTITNNIPIGYTYSNNIQSNAGTYEVTAHLNDGYVWKDDTTSDKKFSCTIDKAKLSKPVVTGYSGTYDGSSHTITVEDVSVGTLKYSVDDVTYTSIKPTITEVGSKNVYVKVEGNENYYDSDSVRVTLLVTPVTPTISFKDKVATLQVGETKNIISLRSNVAGTFTLNSSDETITKINNPSAVVDANEYYNVIATSIKNGEAQITYTFTPLDTNYDFTETKYTLYNVENGKNVVTIPTKESYCLYNIKSTGENIKITKNPEIGMTFSNNVQKNPGLYTITASLLEGYVWSDESTSSKTFDCILLDENDYLDFNDNVIDNKDDYLKSKFNKSIFYSEFYDGINTNGTIKDKEERENTLVKTCDTIKILFEAGTYEYSLIVPGDVDKEGSISISDVDLVYRYLRKKADLSNCQLEAAKVASKESGIHINDVAKIYQYVNEKIERISD